MPLWNTAPLQHAVHLCDTSSVQLLRYLNHVTSAFTRSDPPWEIQMTRAHISWHERQKTTTKSLFTGLFTKSGKKAPRFMKRHRDQRRSPDGLWCTRLQCCQRSTVILTPPSPPPPPLHLLLSFFFWAKLGCERLWKEAVNHVRATVLMNGNGL